MGKILRTALGGAVEYEDDDTPWDVRSFNQFGKATFLWLEQSRALHRAAIFLMKDNKPTHQLFIDAPIALLLGGYALESLLKMVVIGAYLEDHGYSRASKWAKDFVPTTHDLVNLAGLAKIRTTKSDKQTLAQITQYSIWASRYPNPAGRKRI